MVIPLYSVLRFKFRKLFNIFSFSCKLGSTSFIGFFFLSSDRPMRDDLKTRIYYKKMCIIFFTNKASSDCSLFSSVPFIIMLQDRSFFSFCSANSSFRVVIIIDRKFIAVRVISCFLVSQIEFSLVLLLPSTAVADGYDNIRSPLFKAFEVNFSSIFF